MVSLHDGFHVGVLGKKHIFREGNYNPNREIKQNFISDSFVTLNELIGTYGGNATMGSLYKLSQEK